MLLPKTVRGRAEEDPGEEGNLPTRIRTRQSRAHIDATYQSGHAYAIRCTSFPNLGYWDTLSNPCWCLRHAHAPCPLAHRHPLRHPVPPQPLLAVRLDHPLFFPDARRCIVHTSVHRTYRPSCLLPSDLPLTTYYLLRTSCSPAPAILRSYHLCFYPRFNGYSTCRQSSPYARFFFFNCFNFQVPVPRYLPTPIARRVNFDIDLPPHFFEWCMINVAGCLDTLASFHSTNTRSVPFHCT